MNHSFVDLSDKLPQHCDDVQNIAEALVGEFHKARESTYQLSFAKRGESGVWMNLARKYDRIDLLAAKVMDGDGGNVGVTLVDTLVDTAMYALKWLSVIQHIRPDDFNKWIAEVFCRDTGMNYDDACRLFYIGKEVTAANHTMAWEAAYGKLYGNAYDGTRSAWDVDAIKVTDAD